MTQDELIDLICTKVRQTDDNARAACALFLKQRAQMLWDGQLWKDALVEYLVTISPEDTYDPVSSVWLPTKGVLLLPPEIRQVIGVRAGQRSLLPTRHELYYRRDFDSFNRSGEAVEYTLLKPVAWEFDTVQSVLFSALTLDVVARLKYTLDGVNTLETELTGVASGEFDDVDAIYALAGASAIGVAAASAGVTVVNNTSSPVSFSTGADVFAPDQFVIVQPGESGTLAAFDTFLYAAVVEDTSPFATYDAGGAAYTGILTVTEGSFEVVASQSTATVLTTQTTAALRQRLRLTYIPGGATAMRILGKRKCPRFTDATDEPPIQGMDNALIAYVCGDMLQRERQYGKAQVLQAEGAALAAELVAVETVQQAFHVRIIPDDGYGESYSETPYFGTSASSSPSPSTGSGGSLYGVGSPEGVKVGEPGWTYVDTSTNGFWVKVSGTGNTGWQQLLG